MKERKVNHRFGNKTCGECALLRTRYLQIGEHFHLQYFCQKRATNGREDIACRNFQRAGI